MNDTHWQNAHWQNRDPWVVVDPLFKREWVLHQPIRYYVVHSEDRDEWFICDRWTDGVVHGTEAKTRAQSIRLFYKWCNREMPDGEPMPHVMSGVAHHGENG